MLAFQVGKTYNDAIMQRPKRVTLAVVTRVSIILAALLVLSGWMLTTPPGFFTKADMIGYAVCHRIPERSFHVGTYQLPLCARCSGMYLGAMLGLFFQILVSKRRSGFPPWRVIIPLALLVLAFAVDGVNSYLYLIKETYPKLVTNIPNLYIPNNILRLLTGSGMGLAISAVMFPAFNQTVWKEQDARPALAGIKNFSILLGVMILVDMLVLTQKAFILYPLAVLSAGGVLVLLTMIYGIFWLMIFHQENKYERITQTWLALLAGLTISILQIALIDALRYWLTGTWAGFPLR
jgi:uncharacterized membrane protein